MAQEFYANVPISEPTPSGFTHVSDMGGFGWDPKQGLFIPVLDHEVSQFQAPNPGPNIPRPTRP